MVEEACSANSDSGGSQESVESARGKLRAKLRG